MIFDKTTLEINYPFHVEEDSKEGILEQQFHQPISKKNVNKEPNVEEQCTQPINEEIVDKEPNLEEQLPQPINKENIHVDISPARKSEDKLPIPLLRPPKKVKQENCRTQSEAKRGKGDRFAKRTESLTGKEKANALTKARTSYQSDNPPFSIEKQFHQPINQENVDKEPILEEQFHQPTNQENVDMHISPTEKSEDKPSLPILRSGKKRKQDNCRTQFEAKRGKGNISKRTQSLTGEEKVNALHRARNSYKSDNPSFSIVMQPTYISNEAVTIPASFASKYFTEQRGNIILNSVDGKSWTAEYVSYVIQERYRSTVIGTGWRKFVEENHLEIGDVCVFEMIDHIESKLKVVICKENHDAAKSIPSTGNNKHLKPKETPCLKGFTTVNPYFKVKLHKCYLDSCLFNVPAKFMAEVKDRSMEKATLQVENKVWPVKLLSYPPINKIKFSAGVSTFCDDNSLKVGDVCVFELINSETLLIKVSIFRKP
ncbi:B3 domain-containing protein_Os12g40080-like isoform X2 [Euphorbia lathyris]